MQFQYPYYVAPVHTTDDYSTAPTHCSFELRPSVVLLLAWYLAIARLLERLAPQFTEVRFRFTRMQWLAAPWQDELSRFKQILENGGVVSAQEIEQIFWTGAQNLQGYEVEVTSLGSLRFLCYHKHSGTEYYSDAVPFKALFKTLQFNSILAEIRERFQKHNRGPSA